MKSFLKWAAVAAAMVLLVAAGGFVWASRTAAAMLDRTFTAHAIELPVPMPLTEAELEELREERRAEGAGEAGGEDEAAHDALADVDLDALALERAVDRGQHLVEARFVCVECHGADFGGGVMVEDPAMGSLLGPNITTGRGSVTREYTIADWDRIVRHGIKRDGRPALMPSEDFVRMSDRELTDIVAYIRSRPPVDREVPRSTLGPLGKALVSTGKMRLSADLLRDHEAGHEAEPPMALATVEFGAHLAQVCSGCHRANLEGGPVPVGPPSWPAAANLTPHADGLAGWTYEQFVTVMREGRRPNGEMVLEPMSVVIPYGARMTDTELEALWMYLESMAPVPKGS